MTEQDDHLADTWSEELAALDRITFEPGKLGGKACIRGMRISAALIARMIAGGATPAEIVADYPDLDEEDIRQALMFASLAAEKYRRTEV